MAKYVPFMYIHFAKLFLQMIRKRNLDHRIKYFEYEEQGWTFHSKGEFVCLLGHVYYNESVFFSVQDCGTIGEATPTLVYQ